METSTRADGGPPSDGLDGDKDKDKDKDSKKRKTEEDDDDDSLDPKKMKIIIIFHMAWQEI